MTNTAQQDTAIKAVQTAFDADNAALGAASTSITQLNANLATVTAARDAALATDAQDDATIQALNDQVAALKKQIADQHAVGSPFGWEAGKVMMGSTFGESEQVSIAEARRKDYFSVASYNPGVHHEYYQPTADGLAKAEAMMTWDAANGMLSWPTWKLPATWGACSTGAGDAFFKQLNALFKKLGNPAMCTLHHEPENDQFTNGATGTQRPGYLPSDYVNMYERAKPIIQSGIDFVAFGPILMHGGVLGTSFGGNWTPTKLGFNKGNADFFGVDSYVNKMQAVQPDEGPTLHACALAIAPTGLRPALAEYGYSDTSYAGNPGSISRSGQSCADDGYITDIYFDSLANSVKDWRLVGVRLTDFGVLLKSPLASRPLAK